MSSLENNHLEFNFKVFKKRLKELQTIKKERELTYGEEDDYLNICDILKIHTNDSNKKTNIFNVRKHLGKNLKEFNNFASTLQKNYLKNIPKQTNLMNINYEDCRDIKKIKMPFNIQEQLLRKIFSFDNISNQMLDYILDSSNHSFSYKKGNSNFFMVIDNTPLLSVDKNDTIESFLNLVHELAHFYDFLTRSKEYNYDKKTLLYDEIFSLFFELIAIEELKNSNIINDEEANKLFTIIQETNMNNYAFVLNAIITDFHYYNLKDLSKDLKGKKDKMHYIKYYIQQLFNLTLNEKIGFCNLEFPFPEIAEYNFSYLLALNLFYISKDDFDKAIKYLYQINSSLNSENEEVVLKNIYCDKDKVISTINKHNSEKILKRNN